MLDKSEVLTKLHDELPVLKERFAVQEIGLFGSYAKNQENRNSDIDILVSIEDSKNDLFNFLDLKYYLEKMLFNNVDLVMKDAVKIRVKEQILRETIYV